MERVRSYYSLTKPGVLYGNVITGAAGFLFAAGRHIDLWLFAALTVGMTLVIASACALNNVLDVDIDSKMARTKKRAIVAGKVSRRGGAVLSVALGIAGMVVLIAYTNWLVVLIGALGYVTYVVLYGMLSKRLSVHGTLVGSLSGAAPILAGYVAVKGHLDAGAVLVFLALFFWQFPEFFSIAIYRLKEYKAAGIPVMSVVRGVPATKLQIFVYTVLFVLSTLLLSVFGYTGLVYTAVMASLGIYWLRLAVQGLKKSSGDRWARSMFGFSLIVLLAYSALLSLNAWLP